MDSLFELQAADKNEGIRRYGVVEFPLILSQMQERNQGKGYKTENDGLHRARRLKRRACFLMNARSRLYFCLFVFDLDVGIVP